MMMSKYLSVAAAVLLLTACSSDPEKPVVAIEAPPASTKPVDVSNKKGGVAVNAYLWRASLEALSFMPMDQTDPFGGTIKTGWHTAAATPNERLRVAVFILDSRLRADALRVSVFKEVKGSSGNWTEATVDPETVTKLENLILNKARALKIQAGD
jgi:hypothetical protein